MARSCHSLGFPGWDSRQVGLRITARSSKRRAASWQSPLWGFPEPPRPNRRRRGGANIHCSPCFRMGQAGARGCNPSGIRAWPGRDALGGPRSGPHRKPGSPDPGSRKQKIPGTLKGCDNSGSGLCDLFQVGAGPPAGLREKRPERSGTGAGSLCPSRTPYRRIPASQGDY